MSPHLQSVKTVFTSFEPKRTVRWILASRDSMGVGLADGDGLEEGLAVGVAQGVGTAVAWMNGLWLVNWSRSGTCCAGSEEASALLLDDDSSALSARLATAGWSALYKA